MFKKTLLALAIAGAISGCSMLGKIAEIGKGANDEALKTSEFTICKATSVGAIMRRFNTKKLAEAWINLCTTSTDAFPVMLQGVNDE